MNWTFHTSVFLLTIEWFWQKKRQSRHKKGLLLYSIKIVLLEPIMPILNPEKAYQLPEKKQDGTGIEINHDELTRLIQAAREYLEPAAFERFQEHMHSKATADSAYAQIRSVRQGLKIIHDHFFHANTAPSDKASIILKLEERSANCPPGFHNGVNAIVEGFYLANSINELLYRVRRDLVARAANQLTDEVHANNDCFTIAAASGYGIWPLNKEDIYHGGLSTATIQEKLAEVFEFGMRLFPLLQNLDDQLRGQLVNAGYMGASETGYLAEELEKMEEQLSVLFHDHPVANALLDAQACEKALREPYEKKLLTAKAWLQTTIEDWAIKNSLNLNAHKPLKLNFLITGIGQHLLPKLWVAALPNDYKEELQPLIAQLPKIPADLIEAKTRLMQAKHEFDELFFTADKTNVHWSNIRQLLWSGIKDEGYFTFTEEEIALIDTLMHPEPDINQCLMELEQRVIQWSDTDVISAINTLNTLDNSVKSDLIERQFAITENSYTFFKALLASLHDSILKSLTIKEHYIHYTDEIEKDVSVLIQVIPWMNPNDMAQFFLQTRRFEGIPLLEYVFTKRKRGEEALALIRGLTLCPDTLKNQVLTQTNENGNNAFIIAARHQPSAIQPLLDALAGCNNLDLIQLMIHSKHYLADYAKTNDPSLQCVLSVLARKPLNEQAAFYASWIISSPLLKQRGLKELHAQQSLQTLINKIQTSDASTQPISWEHVSFQLKNYLTKSPRKPNELVVLYKLIDTLIHNTTLQTQFDASAPSSRSRFSMFQRHEQDYATTVKQLKQQLCEMAPDLHLEQLDHPSNPIQYR